MWQRLKNLKIRTITYLLVMFMIVAGAFTTLALTRTTREVSTARQAWDRFIAVTMEKMVARAGIIDAVGIGGFVSNYKDAILKRSKGNLDVATRNAEQASDAIARFRALSPSPAEAAALTSIQGVLRQYTSTLPTIALWIDLGAATEEIVGANPIDDRPLLAAVTTLNAEVAKAREIAEDEVHRAVIGADNGTRLAWLVVTAMTVLVMVTFLWVVRARVIRPLDRLVAFASRVGRGDLSAEVAAFSKDEVGALASEMNAMVKGLRDIAVQTRHSAATLTSAATETLASTKQQAASVEQQFAAIQETTATLEEINASGQQMTGRAREIAAEAEKAHERSKDGLKAMDDMTQVMDAIEEQTESVASHIVALSEKTQAIGDIIATVNDIAERSQLLALNAAIEAAAAGEGGRSFSVVADEIKTLADQAKEATGQVSSILGEIQKGINASVMSTEESVKRVATGRGQTGNTLKAITDLAETIEASVRAFDQIVASANQQRIGLEQVSEVLSQIRSGSEQTAAGTRQIETAVGNISALGTRLDHAMERYAV